MASIERTTCAFDEFRTFVCPPRAPHPDRIEDDSECLQMVASDGLDEWIDGPAGVGRDKLSGVPAINTSQLDFRRLWVVRLGDVVHAAERGPYASNVRKGVIKHTNLTGGKPAHSGGELIFLDDETIVLNGRSGRYGPRSEQEMTAVAKAFRKSGYFVWSCGYDVDTAQPFPFSSVDPVWIELE